ncbi:hypothetical protein OS493_024965 [Desmophyllum pertusum]|uniref:Uncharacterized protein n=1 Tax=Desmophyllum pertusum TaxID=174260 RepID=A0A9W9YLH1_9CNID|nr:hypothetical protein OS493_024965 [Desmophyllum pertusum]
MWSIPIKSAGDANNVTLVNERDVKFYEVLSLDLLRNSVMALVELRVLEATKSVDGAVLISVPSSAKVNFFDLPSNTSLFSSHLFQAVSENVLGNVIVQDACLKLNE